MYAKFQWSTTVWLSFRIENTAAALTTFFYSLLFFFFFFQFWKVALAHSVGVATALKRIVNRRWSVYVCVWCMCICVRVRDSMNVWQRDEADETCACICYMVLIHTGNDTVYLYSDGAVHEIVAAILLVEFRTHTCNRTNRRQRSIDLWHSRISHDRFNI